MTKLKVFLVLALTFPASLISAQEPITWPCAGAPPTLSSTIPSDTAVSDQVNFNCFAWQEFIGVNWPTDGSPFGEPGNTSRVVFETYGDVHDLMPQDGDEPPVWGAWHTSEDEKSMRRTSKFGTQFIPADIQEAAPTNGRAWLADTNGNLVWYEILVNEDEYNYIRDNKFYRADRQQSVTGRGTPINVVQGSLSGPTGGMEFKAAWLRITDPENKRWKRYKVSAAEFCSDGDCTDGFVALVGLHILHKTVSQPSWVWATFEHVDNAPDLDALDELTAEDSFTFFSSQCETKPVPCKCQDGRCNRKLQTSCEPNQAPAYKLDLDKGEPRDSCPAYPIQVARTYSLPDTNENPIVATNKAAHELIRQHNEDSVYQYYKLVNVLWNDSPVDENLAANVPKGSLSKTGFRPNTQAFPVSNTVLETYVQGTSCIECHSFAKIATTESSKQDYTADYSFIFRMAK